MNADRLHAIALGIRADIQETKTVERLKQLRDALQQQVNQPQQPNHQKQVSELRKELTAALSSAPSNSFSAAWQQILDEIGASPLLGDQLRERIEHTFARNQITPSVALEEVTNLHKQAEQLFNAVQQLTQALRQLSIGSEQLEPGECELGVLVPRPAVNNQLAEFGRELRMLDRTFGTFAELATGNRPGFTIRTISSTDLAIFLALVPKIAACIAVAVERIVSLYKQLLEIRLLRDQLDGQGVPAKDLKGIDNYANTHMENGIEELVEELLERYASDVDKGRRNELRTELKHSLNAIANRIDLGYNIDVRAQPLPAPEEDGDDGADASDREAVQTIEQASVGLQFLKPTGRPILSLPEPQADAGPEDA